MSRSVKEPNKPHCGAVAAEVMRQASVIELSAEGNTECADGSRGGCGVGCSVAVDMQLRKASFALHRGQVGEETPETKTLPEGAAVYRNIRANLLVLIFCVCWA